MWMSTCLSLLFTSALTVVSAGTLVTKDAANYTDGCAALTKVLQTKVFYARSTVYEYENQQFWSNNQRLSPLCVFRPSSTSDVAVAVKALKVVSGTFALRGGGHMAIKGANNVDNGVLMVTSNLSTIALSSDKSILTLGPAHRWGAVYKWLSKYDLAVAGGRLSPVGVPGLLLGGGVSFYGNQVGWSCDTVLKYELVTADGKIVYPTKTNLPDLFWALKGGSSNFGIVTNFYVKTIKSKKIFAGVYSVGDANIPAFLAAVANYSSNIIDPLSHIAPAVVPVSRSPPAAIGAAILFYDSETNSNPDCFRPFFDIPSISSTMRFQTLAEFADETGTVVIDGINDIFAAGTVYGQNYAQLLQGIEMTNKIFNDRLPLLYAKIPASNVTIVEVVWQPIGKLWQAATQKAGGNALGLDPKKVYLCWSQVVEWTGSQYDDTANSWVFDTTNVINAAAKKAGIYDPFVYMGDSTGFQTKDFYSGYGSSNKAKLLEISRKYDPSRVFQKLLPGGFKIGY